MKRKGEINWVVAIVIAVVLLLIVTSSAIPQLKELIKKSKEPVNTTCSLAKGVCRFQCDLKVEAPQTFGTFCPKKTPLCCVPLDKLPAQGSNTGAQSASATQSELCSRKQGSCVPQANCLAGWARDPTITCPKSLDVCCVPVDKTKLLSPATGSPCESSLTKNMCSPGVCTDVLFTANDNPVCPKDSSCKYTSQALSCPAGFSCCSLVVQSGDPTSAPSGGTGSTTGTSGGGGGGIPAGVDCPDLCVESGSSKALYCDGSEKDKPVLGAWSWGPAIKYLAGSYPEEYCNAARCKYTIVSATECTDKGKVCCQVDEITQAGGS